VGNVVLTAPIKHIHHGTETYGLRIKGKKHTIAYIADTRYFNGLIKAYKSDILIVSVLRVDPSRLDHLCIEDVKKLVTGIKPKTTILTHFGMWMIRAKPWEVAESLSRELHRKVIAASDGMLFKI
jgi:ribonuclease BN (tRNA processing enzyme)